MKITLGLIVEGHGDVQAAPVLVRRMIQEIDPQIQLRIPSPIRIPKNRMVRPGELRLIGERFFAIACSLAIDRLPGDAGPPGRA